MKKKRLLIIIIVLLVLLILAGAVFAYVYFGTDLLKSDKELFAKYASTLADSENGFIPNILREYENKKELNTYQNSGNFSISNNLLADTSTDEFLQEFQNLLNISNNANITFSGNVDRVNNRAEENISINYSETVNLPFIYKQDGDIYGIQADILTPNYIAVENNNLQEFCQKLGATDVSSIPNKIEESTIESLQFNEEEKTHILENYIMPIYNNLSDDKFSKNEVNDGMNNYVLTLTNDDAKNILVQTLQTLSNDTVMLEKINNIAKEIYGETVDTITSEDVSALVQNLNAQDLEIGNIIITLTEEDKIVNNINITNNTFTIDINKTQTDSTVAYNLNLNNTEGYSLNLVITYEGMNTNNVSENITLILNMPDLLNTTYTYNNIISFTSVTIDPFDNNVVILNNYPAEQLQPFLENVGNIIAQTNSSQMQQIGFAEEYINPIIIGITSPSIFSAASIINNAIDTIEDVDLPTEQGQLENVMNDLNTINNNGNTITESNISNGIVEAENLIN